MSPTPQDATIVGMPDSWTIRHFAQANPRGPDQGNVPALLRRVADSVEALGPVTVQDLILHDEVTEDGPWVSLTMYFSPDDTPSSNSPRP